MVAHPPIRFGVIGINHNHIYGQVDLLLRAGAELVAFYASEPDLAAKFTATYPQAQPRASATAVLEDETIRLIVTAGIPAERAPLGITAMQHDKDFMSDKPGFTTLEQLQQARQVQAATGRIYSICFSERFENAATVRAGELARSGTIGQVVQTIGLGPHRANLSRRPAWFFQRERYGGILTDIGSHQVDQFLYFTGATAAEVVSAQVANHKYPEHPELEDFGEMLFRSEAASGYVRVDWYTPDGLNTWGDGRLFILGTTGFIEVRKNCDLAGRLGGNHLLWADQHGSYYEDCQAGPLPYGAQLLADVRDRTETAMTQAHCFLASELALRAEALATLHRSQPHA